MVTAATVALVIVGLSALLATVQVWRGPTFPDRVVGLDSLGTHVMALTALFAVYTGTRHYLDAVVFLALLGFLGTIAAAKFFAKGVPITGERD